MNWKDLVNLFSRKAEIVLITIAGLVYVANLAGTEGDSPDIQAIKWAAIKWAIAGIIWIGTVGTCAQTVLDYKWPKHYAPQDPAEKPEPTIENSKS